MRLKEATKPKQAKQADDALVFWGTHADTEYLRLLKPCVGSATTFLRSDPVLTLSSVSMYCRQKGISRVISSSPTLLTKLLNWTERKAPSIDSYAGSYFTIPPFKVGDPEIEVVFIKPLKQLVTVPFGKFMAKRIVSKLTSPDSWYVPTKFTGFSLLTASTETLLHAKFSKANLICVDVETFKENAVIRCLSYTSFDTTANTSESVVLALDSDYALAIMRKWNKLPAPKIMQNGKYDAAYFCRYSAPLHNYLYDTAHLFHSWYSELPKDLGFLNAFFLRKAMYWKDLAHTNDLYEYYRYNALDTWGTGNAFLAMLHEAPDWAIGNYLLEFPLVFPCHLSEMTGLARDMDRLAGARKEADYTIDTLSKQLNTILDIPAGESFNVKSPLQMKALFKLLGCVDLPSCDAKNIAKAIFRHPFNARVLRLVLDIREARTLKEKYLQTGAKATEFTRQDGTGHRVLYALNPHGTDTSRLASREHHFWTGLQIQNIPRGPSVKQTIKADPDFYLCEVDLEQAESRDTGYISGDAQLIHNVEYSPDFHCANASCFFGVPFEDLYDEATGKVLNKPLRQIGKPVNHGANYNMGAYVLVDTMGEPNIVKAKQLLNLNRFWSHVQVATYLLEQFHRTYPAIKGVFYEGVKDEIRMTSKLSSMAWHHSWEQTGNIIDLAKNAEGIYEQDRTHSWVRYCFGNPDKSKQQLNSYIAHPPQSLNAQTLNKAYLSVFKDIAINPQHKANFKLNAQVHDSIIFQYRKGHEYLIQMVVERMEVPITIKAYDGKVRTFVVPAGAKRGQHLDKNCAEYWSETE